MTIDCQQCREELPEFALGQSEPPVAARVDEHLRACVVCRYELAELECDWSLLAAAAESATPPADLFERIAGECSLGDREARQPGAAHRQLESRDPVASPPLSGRQRLASYALAASVLIAVTWGAASSLGLLARPPERDRGQAAAEELLRGLADVEQFERLADGRDVRLVAATSRESAARARAVIAWDLVARQWHFYALDLPPAPAGQAYQLWIEPPTGKPLLAGPRLEVDAHGVARALVEVPDLDPRQHAHARVTLEPTAGDAAEEPSGAAVLDAEL